MTNTLPLRTTREPLVARFEAIPIRRIMRPGVVSVAADASLAQAMAAHQVHAVLVFEPRSPAPTSSASPRRTRDRHG